MRHLRRPHPLLAAVLGLWLIFAMVEPVTWHPCPMHDGMMTSQTGTHAAMAGMADDDRSPTSATAAAGASTEKQGSTESHGRHACGCLSTGCCGAPATLPVAADVGHWGLAVLDVRRDVLAPDAPLPSAADHVIPFANGPPAASAA
jgi:hypothetical protein